MKHRLITYIAIDMALYIAAAAAVYFFSGYAADEKRFLMIVMFAVNILWILMLALVNYIWFRILPTDTFVKVNLFCVCMPVMGIAAVVLIHIPSFKDNIGIVAFLALVLATWMLTGLYVSNRIAAKRGQ
jgi:hypothetical protein